MRAERPRHRASARFRTPLLVAAGLLGGYLVGSVPGALAGAGLGSLLAVALRRRDDRRHARRRAALAPPFPEEWRQNLRERYDHFDRLPEALRRRFEDDLRLFLCEKRITGVGVEVTDELRLLVAASAVTLSLCWPDYEWDQLTEVLLYPQAFDRDYGFGEDRPDVFDDEGHLRPSMLSGEAHPWGTVMLSVPSLLESFEDPDDAYHVGLHEFAHLLDVDQTRFDGIPGGLSGDAARRWVAAADRERERLVREEHGRQVRDPGRRRPRAESVFDPYGASDPVEFLAVAVEAFFEASLEVRAKHREVYELLSEYFGQDPAAWDDARGLVLD